MTADFFPNPRVRQRLHEGPLSPHIDAFATLLREQGYTQSTTQHQLRLVAELSRWLERRNLTVSELGTKRNCQFLRSRRRRGQIRHGDAATLELLLKHFEGAGLVRAPAPTASDSPLCCLERAFAQHLTQERGLTQATLASYLPVARRFVSERFGEGPFRLAELRADDVTGYVLRHAHDLSPARAKMMVTALRALFRFLLLRGEIATDLAACVPTVADWRLTSLPKSIEEEQAEGVLEHCDRKTKVGMRDYAILLLLARLGLRGGEVATLSLEDLHWEAGEITIRGKGGRHHRLPLPQDVGEALVTYLREGRPRCSTRRVFVRARAPRRGFSSSVAIADIVRRALERAGLHPPRKGAHLLRHTLATQMLRKGASLAEIGEVLRHQHPDTTAIYAKVDLQALRALAQPWPGGEA